MTGAIKRRALDAGLALRLHLGVTGLALLSSDVGIMRIAFSLSLWLLPSGAAVLTKYERWMP